MDATDLYKCLKEAYDEVLRRRTFLSDRASTLIGFDGVAVAVLTGFMGTSRANTILLVPIAFSLLFYLSSTLSAVLAIWEKEWYVVPSVPNAEEILLREPSAIAQKVSVNGFIMQVIKATELNEAENWRKYGWLRYGYLFLALAVFLSTTVGLIAIFSRPSSHPWR